MLLGKALLRRHKLYKVSHFMLLSFLPLNSTLWHRISHTILQYFFHSERRFAFFAVEEAVPSKFRYFAQIYSVDLVRLCISHIVGNFSHSYS